jgi:hypothetical protein
MAFAPDTNQLATSWTDAFATELGYRVEKQGNVANWVSVETLPASTNTGEVRSWTGALDRSAKYRVVALRDGYVVPLEIAPGVTTAAIEEYITTPAIQVSGPLPLRSSVQFSIAGVGTATAARYLLDATFLAEQIVGRELGTSTLAPNFPSAPVNSGALGLGSHSVHAIVSVAPGVEIRLQRNVEVVETNPDRPSSSWRYTTSLDANDMFSFYVGNGRSEGFNGVEGSLRAGSVWRKALAAVSVAVTTLGIAIETQGSRGRQRAVLLQ